MSKIEPAIKLQYEKIFQVNDWDVFKQLAEYYLDVAANLKTKDLPPKESNKLWKRNVQKRLFIGVACELLLKAHFLRKGYEINKPTKVKWHLYPVQDVNPKDYQIDDTYPMGFLLDNLKHGPVFNHEQVIERGFRIANVFRNKEGHVAVYWHQICLLVPFCFTKRNWTAAGYTIEMLWEQRVVLRSRTNNNSAR